LTYSLSFAPDFFFGSDETDIEGLSGSKHPASVAEAILRLSEESWNALAEQVFGVDGSQLDLATVLDKVIATNMCLNLDSPVEVCIDEECAFTVLVYEHPH
jgi:hypothetical protein